MKRNMKQYLFVVTVILMTMVVFQIRLYATEKSLTNNNIISMIKIGSSDAIIVLLIQESSTKFDISPNSLIKLKKAGVSESLIKVIISAYSSPNKKKQSIAHLSNKGEFKPHTNLTRKPLSIKELRTHGAVLQSHEYSCGAAALATLMGLMGKPATEGQVLSSIFGDKLPIFKDKKDGKEKLRALTMADLEKGARKEGFKVVSVQVPDPIEAEKNLYFFKPVITRMVLYNDYLHFVVLRDIEDGWVYVTDPGYGNFKITWKQFHEAWKAGDQIFLSIGQHPFYAWKDEKSKQLYLKRNEKDVLPIKEQITPSELFRFSHRKITQMGSLIR